MIKFKKRKIFITSQTKVEFLNEKMKAMQRIKNNQFKMTKAIQIIIN